MLQAQKIALNAKQDKALLLWKQKKATGAFLYLVRLLANIYKICTVYERYIM